VAEIREVRDASEIVAAGHLFDHPPVPASVAAFVADPKYHLLAAYEDGLAVGFATGIELVLPDHGGPELLLYELSVEEGSRRRGIGTALVERMIALAREHGCDEVWVLTELDNDAAHATYRAAGGRRDPDSAMFVWKLD